MFVFAFVLARRSVPVGGVGGEEPNTNTNTVDVDTSAGDAAAAAAGQSEEASSPITETGVIRERDRGRKQIMSAATKRVGIRKILVWCTTVVSRDTGWLGGLCGAPIPVRCGPRQNEK